MFEERVQNYNFRIDPSDPNNPTLILYRRRSSSRLQEVDDKIGGGACDMRPRHRDVTGLREPKHNNTKIETLRRKYPGFAEGTIRSDATLGALKDKLGLPQSASLNDVRKKLKKPGK